MRFYCKCIYRMEGFKNKRVCKKMLQRNLPEELKARRKSEYKEWKKRVREMIEESG